MGKNVLIVDDSEVVRDIGAFVLTSAGYGVFSAAGGAEALEILARETVDLTVVDINMPGMDGYTLIRKIREDRVFGDMPIVIVTTEAEAKDKKAGFDAGADTYLIKPVGPDELLVQVGLLVGGP